MELQQIKNPQKQYKKLKEVLKVAEDLKKNPAVSAVILFGSYATGKNKPTSDVDVAAILEDISKETEAEIGSMYNPNIDLTLFHRLPLHIQYQVLREGKPIYVRNEEHLRELKLKTLTRYQDMQYTYEQRKKHVMSK